jgi:hypothetical protein
MFVGKWDDVCSALSTFYTPVIIYTQKDFPFPNLTCPHPLRSFSYDNFQNNPAS